MSKESKEAIHNLANSLRNAHKEDVKNHYNNKHEIKLSDEEANELLKLLENKKLVGAVEYLELPKNNFE